MTAHAGSQLSPQLTAINCSHVDEVTLDVSHHLSLQLTAAVNDISWQNMKHNRPVDPENSKK